MFDDIFGGIFDFNGDGHKDFLEEATGFAIINELTEAEESDNTFFDVNNAIDNDRSC